MVDLYSLILMYRHDLNMTNNIYGWKFLTWLTNLMQIQHEISKLWLNDLIYLIKQVN